jgi:hypothetical protein
MPGETLDNAGDLADHFATYEAEAAARPFVPLSCDLVTISPEKGAELQARVPPIDPFVDRLAIARVIGTRQEWIRHPGTNGIAYFPPENATRTWLAAAFGPASYHVQARNRQNQIIGGQRCDVGIAPGQAPPGFYHPASPGQAGAAPAAAPQYPVAAPWGQFAPPAGQYPPPWGYAPAPAPAPAAPATETIAERFMVAMLAKFSNQLMAQPPAPALDPIRESVAEIAKLAALGQQRQAPVESVADKLLPLLLKDLLEDRRRPNPSADAGTPEKTIALLKLGATLFGEKKGKKEESEWLAIIPEVVDSIGPGFIVALAQAGLPADKADMVTRVVSEHMGARKAEAEAAGTGEPIDTIGEELP